MNRYYDPTTDQFLSIDPDVATTDQPYVFTNDDPLNAEDPLGLFCWSWKCLGNDVLVNAKAAGSALAIVATTVGSGAIDDEGQGSEADDAILRWYEDDSESASRSEGASCGGQSFTPITDVQLASGAEVPIDQVKVGDLVLATNVLTGKVQAEPVTNLWVNDDHDLMDVVVRTLWGDSTIHTTQHHLFWDLTTRQWTEADHLAAGDQLETSDGVIATVESEPVIAGSAEMWDLTVSNDHDFYVLLEGVNQDAVLVHNCPGGQVPDDSDLGQAIGRGARVTDNFDDVAQRLETNNGLDRQEASDELHAIKAQLEGNRDVLFTRSGGVYDSISGEHLGDLLRGR
jgi:hypothetical protein